MAQLAAAEGAAEAPAADRVADERARLAMRLLTSQRARNSIAHLAGHTAERYHWSGDGVVAYSVRRRVAVCLGDPIGGGRPLGPAVASFQDWCAAQGFVCCFHQTQGAEPYRELGFRLVALGAEALVPSCSLGHVPGSERANLRYAVRRAARDGVRVEIMPAPLAWTEYGLQLQAISQTWLARRGGREMGFSLGGASTLRDPAVVAAVAVRHERVEAFLTWLPVPSTSTWTLDLMRRLPDASYGVLEHLVVESAAEARARGIVTLNLGLAPFFCPAGVADAGLGPVGRVLYPRLARFRRSRTLRHFKAKFGPHWDTRYLAIAGGAGVGRALTAVLDVHAGSATPWERLAVIRSWW